MTFLLLLHLFLIVNKNDVSIRVRLVQLLLQLHFNLWRIWRLLFKRKTSKFVGVCIAGSVRFDGACSKFLIEMRNVVFAMKVGNEGRFYSLFNEIIPIETVKPWMLLEGRDILHPLFRVFYE